MSSAALIRLRSAGAPSAGSGSPSVIAISTCVTRLACAEMALAATSGGAVSGIPAARPRMPEASALAIGALTWSSEARAASTACGHSARCCSLARSRCSSGAYSRS